MPQIHRQVLRDRVKQAGLSQRQLAHATNASQEHIQNVLAGRRLPSVDLTHRLAQVLKCEPAELLVPSGNALRQRRQLAGFEAPDLAAKAGISYVHLNGIECGRKKASARVIAELAAVLGCQESDLTDVAA